MFALLNFVEIYLDRPSGWAFFVGFLQAAYTSPDTEWSLQCVRKFNLPNAKFQRPLYYLWLRQEWLVSSYVIPILFVLPEVAMLLSVTNGQSIGLLFKTVTRSAGGEFGLLFLILGIIFRGCWGLDCCIPLHLYFCA